MAKLSGVAVYWETCNLTCIDQYLHYFHILISMLYFQAHNAKQLSGWCLHFISTNLSVFESTEEFDLVQGENRQHVYEHRWPPLSKLNSKCKVMWTERTKLKEGRKEWMKRFSMTREGGGVCLNKITPCLTVFIASWNIWNKLYYIVGYTMYQYENTEVNYYCCCCCC